MKVVILGRGRVGRGLANALRSGHGSVRLRSGRTGSAAGADAVILAVPDQEIHNVARRITARLSSKATVLHTAGARPAEELAPCQTVGASIGAMHPLISFADPKRAPSMVGASFLISGDRKATAVAKQLATAMRGRPIVAAVHGPAYHAAASLVANGAVGLSAVGVHILTKLGLRRRDAEHAVGGLLRTVADNIEELGLPRALTGPIVRGDADTVRAHRRALRNLGTEARDAYDRVGPLILGCALEAGLSADRARAIRRSLRE